MANFETAIDIIILWAFAFIFHGFGYGGSVLKDKLRGRPQIDRRLDSYVLGHLWCLMASAISFSIIPLAEAKKINFILSPQRTCSVFVVTGIIFLLTFLFVIMYLGFVKNQSRRRITWTANFLGVLNFLILGFLIGSCKF